MGGLSAKRRLIAGQAGSIGLAAPPVEVDVGDLGADIGFRLRIAQDASFRACVCAARSA